MNNIKVAVIGLGAMGGGIAKMVLGKKGLSLVGAYARREAKAGKDLAEVIGLDGQTGVIVTNSMDELLAARADVVIHAVTSFVEEAYPEIVKILSAGQNIVSIAEELAYPQVGSPDLTAKIDEVARAGGVTVLGTGINPGFVLDALILTLTGACIEVKKINASRVNDLSPFGSTVMRTQGVGTTVEEFEKGLENGTIVGHIGFPESIGLIADTLGWELDEVVQTREPIISNTYRETPYVKVHPGMVAGCRHVGIGMRAGEPLITLEHPQQIHPGEEGIETGDYIRIEGTPEINMAIKPEIPGGIGTIALAVNMIPQVINAEPGLTTMADLPIPRAFA
ncbi:NAD(P)-binding domain-containing protein [Candidatus Bipolaricaulota bacterium]|nr:NAD(P)-binding domain-containing protein [Candidatus Bipolaricaulota bacterium]